MSAEKNREPLSAVSSQASMPAGAVFLSYASEDAAAAERIATALRTAGIEVWFDKSELRGGDAWDRQIREQIQACALFMPVISANAHARVEGYFRLEWKLAVDRSHRMAPDQAFLIPVAIDDMRQNDTRIPDRFRELQWTRLLQGETTQVIHRTSQEASVRTSATRTGYGAVGGRCEVWGPTSSQGTGPGILEEEARSASGANGGDLGGGSLYRRRQDLDFEPCVAGRRFAACREIHRCTAICGFE